jgi:succinoglycan biosynthesis transport protein ExoP
MNILEQTQIIWRRRWVIFVTTVTTLIVALVVKNLIPTTYSATATLRIVTPTIGSADYLSYNIDYANRIMNTYVQIAQSSPVLTSMMEQLNLSEVPDIEVNTVPDTELLSITATTPYPELSRDAANTLAAVLISHQRDVGDTRAYIVEPAHIARIPVLVDLLLFPALGLLVGLTGGVGLALLLDRMSTRVYSSQEIMSLTGLPFLGEIPLSQSRRNGYLLNSAVHSESFLRLRTHILHTNPGTTIEITSAEPSEGKSTIVANLGVSIAQLGKDVVLIDADMRQPTLHKIFDLENTVGLGDVLAGEKALSEALRETSVQGLRIITAGTPKSNPANMLSSGEMAAVLTELAGQSDVVLVDVPAFLAVTDASVLAPQMDSVILVIRLGRVDKEAIQFTTQQLADLDARPLGVIINGIRRKPHYRKYYYEPKA